MSQTDIKVAICGPVAAGKTAFIIRVVSDEFTEGTQPTVAYNINFLETTVNGENVKVNFADTPGSQTFLELGAKYFRDNDAIIYVFDSSNEETIDQLKGYIEFAHEHNASAHEYVIGSKFDLIQDDEQKVEQLENHARGLVAQYSDSCQIEFLTLVSSKTNCKVKEVLEVVLHGALEHAKSKQRPDPFPKPDPNQKNPKSGCC